jgi:hypothetical protein
MCFTATVLGETPMMFLHTRTAFLRKRSQAKAPQTRPSSRLWLEELEDRLTPSFAGTAYTYTNAAIQITPNLASHSITETVTATVTTVPAVDPTTGQITGPIPAGAGTPIGTVLFSLNNELQSATLNANGQATATFTVPLQSLQNLAEWNASHVLAVQYAGSSTASGTYSPGPLFIAPIYTNFLNALFPALLTFGQLTPQQVAGNLNTSTGQVTPLPTFNTAQGETDDFGLFAYQYVDPGTINSMTIGSMTLPGGFAYYQIGSLVKQFVDAAV